jgi:hypothetical protein
MIHEEPMSLVKEAALHLVDANGNPIDVSGKKIFMSDGINVYFYNKAKRVLYKRFPTLQPTSPKFGGLIELKINKNILQELIESGNFGPPLNSNNVEFKSEESPGSLKDLAESNSINHMVNEDMAAHDAESGIEDSEDLLPIKHPSDFVYLPLYSTKSEDSHEVPPSSGINQWNAGGRPRSFGEAYIPVPRWTHRIFPYFFPARDEKFKLRLQDGKIVSAKLCQDESKALMSDPNDELCRWLYRTLEPTLSYEKIKSRLPEKRPYTYSDLLKVGKDCVKITKVFGKQYHYELSFSGVGDYEKFKRSIPT